MSQTESGASDTEQGGPESDSVYDFLYHDAQRVGSFLAQFDDAGLLQQVTQSEGAYRGSKRGWKAAAGGSIPTVGSVNISAERGPEKGGFETSERVYDPLWTNARTLLDFLDERGMLRRELGDARIRWKVLSLWLECSRIRSRLGYRTIAEQRCGAACAKTGWSFRHLTSP